MADAKKVEELEQEIALLHQTFSRMGKNSKGEKDIFGREFSVPVDDEHKATQDPLLVTLCNCSRPHMAGARPSARRARRMPPTTASRPPSSLPLLPAAFLGASLVPRHSLPHLLVRLLRVLLLHLRGGLAVAVYHPRP